MLGRTNRNDQGRAFHRYHHCPDRALTREDLRPCVAEMGVVARVPANEYE
jgi:hypothetical protein